MVEEKETPNKGTIDKDLLAILCCPETKQEVSLIDSRTVDQLNAAIEKGELQNKEGHLVKEKLDGGLIRQDRKVVYPIRDQIPIMLIEEGIVIKDPLTSPT
jgi:uncharacterized protein YbaR (Trm112 family)